MNEGLKKELNKILENKQPRYITKFFLDKNYPSLYNRIYERTLFLEKNHPLSERIYCIINDIYEHPKCRNCGKKINTWHSFNSSLKDYILDKYCSISCSKKFKKLNIIYSPAKKYYSKDELLEKINKLKTFFTIDEKIIKSCKFYIKELKIDDNSFSSINEIIYFIKNGLIEKPKCKECNNYVNFFNDHYADFCSSECNLKSKFTKNKREKTCLKKYGVKNIFQNKTIIEKNRKKILELTYKNFKRFSNEVIPKFSIIDYTNNKKNLYLWQCKNCNLKFLYKYENGIIPKCPVCNPGTNIESNIINFLKDNKIIFKKNYRKIINPLELDIFIPKKQIAIEINGLYYHGELSGKNKNYHLNKTQLCKNKDIKLIHIFEDEILLKEKIVKSRLRQILKLQKYKIGARKCQIKEIDTSLKNKFLNKYHIQGEDKSRIKLGAFYKDKLVAVMTFSKLRKALGQKHKENYWELSRFCTIINFTIIGIAGKLLKYFERKWKPLEIVSYADRRWSQGNLYKKLGFKLNHISPPNYWYHNGRCIRHHRFNFRKNILNKKLKKFDQSLTEWENMQMNGWDRIWDCGNLVFKKNY